MAVVSRPPLLRGRHDPDDVGLHRHEVECGELGGVIELPAHGIDQRRALGEGPQVQLFWPPVLVARGTTRGLRMAHHWASCCGRCLFGGGGGCAPVVVVHGGTSFTHLG